MSANEAPGGPGMAPRWTDARKTGVGTAATAKSKLWFTISRGIVTEMYHPRIDQAVVRDLGMIVTDGAGYFSEEKRHTIHDQTSVTPGVPAYRLSNTCRHGRYRIEKSIFTDPDRHVLLQRTRFQPLEGELSDYHVVGLLAPRLGNRGYDNTGWVGEHKGVPMLFAEGEGAVLAIACTAPWTTRSVGFVGASDGWQQLLANGAITRPHDRATSGNIGLAGEIDVAACGGEFVLAVGFGRTPGEAGHRAVGSLRADMDLLEARYIEDWETWHEQFPAPPDDADADLHRDSLMVLKTHEGKDFAGGLIASLSIPWGSERGDDEIGGYHLVWPRDLVLSAGALLAAGARHGVRPVLDHLKATQETDGGWPQNMWLDGSPHWGGIQLDEIALPILLVDLARRRGVVGDDELSGYWEMVRKAAGFLLRHGPITPQDRWEENAGYSPFTLATTVSALLAAAEFAEPYEPELAAYLRDTADVWNDSIERWTYVEGTELADEIGVAGYYVRIAPGDEMGGARLEGSVRIANRPFDADPEPAWKIVSPDALALVRFGLRAADDERIRNTVKVIDALLEVETPNGVGYYRYNGDGYGEHTGGAPYDGTGEGRLWPLLTAERAHYEIAAGNLARAAELAGDTARFANKGRMLPEQVWDTDAIPELDLYPGEGTGSATPLVWAHGEYVKLTRSLQDGAVFDVPPQPVQRYQVDGVRSLVAIWRADAAISHINTGKTLRVESLEAMSIRWSADNWQTTSRLESVDTGVGVHFCDLPTGDLEPGASVAFTVASLSADPEETEIRLVRVAAESDRQGAAAKQAG